MPLGLLFGGLGSLGVTFWSIFSSWLHFGSTLNFLVLENGLGHQWCAKGCPRPVRTMYLHPFQHLVGVISHEFSDFAWKKRFPGSVCVLDAMHWALHSGVSHAIRTGLCSRSTLSDVCFFLKTRDEQITLGLHFGDHVRLNS